MLDPRTGSIASQIPNVYLRAIETERKIKKNNELTNRIEELEKKIVGSRWRT